MKSHWPDGNRLSEILLQNERREIISSNLGSLESELMSDGFFRISRSALINLDYLTHVDNKSGLCDYRVNQSLK